jgi:hypothetical protein
MLVNDYIEEFGIDQFLLEYGEPEYFEKVTNYLDKYR